MGGAQIIKWLHFVPAKNGWWGGGESSRHLQ